MSQLINFRSFAPISGRVDKTNAVVHGVSLITGNIEAEGHQLHVDDKTLDQVHGYSAKRKKITVKMDHTDENGKAFKSIVGYLTNFAVDGTKVRGDLELLKEEPLTPKILEMAERMPENFGLSISFKGKGEKVKGKKFARCEKVLSVDLVEQPAANPDGLFSARVDTGNDGMPENQEPTLADVLQGIQNLSQQFTQLADTVQKHGEFISQVEQSMGEPDLAELAEMSDEQIAGLGYDVDKVRQAIADAEAAGELTPQSDGSATSAEGTTAAPAAAAAAAPAGASFSAKDAQKLIQFEIGKIRKQAREQAEEAEAEIALGVIEDKVTQLSAKNDELTTENAALKAEVASLRRTSKVSGFSAVRAGSDATLFSAKAEAGSYEAQVQAKFEALKKEGKSDVDAKVEAVRFCISKFPGEYHAFRTKQGGKALNFGS